MWPGETEDIKSEDNRYIADYDKEGVRHQNSGLTKEIANGYQLESRSKNWLVIDIDEGMPDKHGNTWVDYMYFIIVVVPILEFVITHPL